MPFAPDTTGGMLGDIFIGSSVHPTHQRRPYTSARNRQPTRRSTGSVNPNLPTKGNFLRDLNLFGPKGWSGVNDLVRAKLQGEASLEEILTPGSPNYVAGADKANVMIMLGGEQVEFTLGRFGNQLYKLNKAQLTQLQQLLYRGGFWEQDDYHNNIVPTWGSLSDLGSKTPGALLRFLQQNLKDGVDSQTSFHRGILAQKGLMDQIDNATGGKLSAGGDPESDALPDVYVNNPFQAIPLTNPTDLESYADQVAQDVLGRKATPEEHLKFVRAFNDMEIVRGQMIANNNQRNDLQGAQNEFLNAAAQRNAKNGGVGGAGAGAAAGGAGAAAQLAAGGKLIYPIAGQSTQGQANSWGNPRSGGRTHKGSDLFTPIGSRIIAAKAGTVVKVGNGGLGGKTVTIQGTDGLYYYYAHLSRNDYLQKGQTVGAGQLVGLSGDTGNAKGTTPHLHFSIYDPKAPGNAYENGAINPWPLLTGAGSTGGYGGGPAANTQQPSGGGANIAAILDTIANFESNHTYNAGITGMYGLTPTGGWKVWGDGSARNASQASKASQDAAATKGVLYWLSRGVKPEDIPLVWYLGHMPSAAEMDVVPNPKQNRLTPRQYQAKWVEYLHAHGGGGGGGTGGATMGQDGSVHGSGTANTFFDMAAPDPQMEAEKMFRREHPEEALANDVSDQYTQFTSILAGAGGST